MRILNYIGEFFLFRWLLGKLRKSTEKQDAHTESVVTSIDSEGESQTYNHDEYIAPNDDAVTPADDDMLDDSIPRNLMIWIYSCAIIAAIIIPICITETMTVIIIITAVTAVLKIGIPEVIHNRLTIAMKSRTTTT